VVVCLDWRNSLRSKCCRYIDGRWGDWCNTARTFVAVLLPSICMHIPVPYHADNDIERAHAVGTAVTTRWLRSLVCTHTRDYRGVWNLATRDRPSIVLHRITLSRPTHVPSLHASYFLYPILNVKKLNTMLH
jgi:hypothetical protein